MAIIINSKQEVERLASLGFTYAEGFVPAYDHDRQIKGVIKEATGEFKMTFPLNGHRSRNLTELLFEGKRDASLLHLGYTNVISVRELRALPGFDQKYYDILGTMIDLGAHFTIFEVVEKDTDYGWSIVLTSGKVGS